MTPQFAILPHIALRPGTSFAHTTEPPPLVGLDSPRRERNDEFRHVRPITIEPHAAIDDALDKMKAAGVRLLFVIDAADCIVGLITATDIMGEKPITLAQQSQIPRSKIGVETIMTPQSQVGVLSKAAVDNAEVGHIIATMRDLDRRHALVVNDADDIGQQVIGMFSATEIGKRIGRDLREEVAPAHSLAELVHTIG